MSLPPVNGSATKILLVVLAALLSFIAGGSGVRAHERTPGHEPTVSQVERNESDIRQINDKLDAILREVSKQ